MGGCFLLVSRRVFVLAEGFRQTLGSSIVPVRGPPAPAVWFSVLLLSLSRPLLDMLARGWISKRACPINGLFDNALGPCLRGRNGGLPLRYGADFRCEVNSLSRSLIGAGVPRAKLARAQRGGSPNSRALTN